MAENKQYIEQVHDHGNVMISEDVIATIMTHAVNEVEGAEGLSIKSGAVGVKNWSKGMKITIAENNELTIACNVVIKFGQSVVETAKAVQSSITSAVESMTGVNVVAVNVNVCGIVRQ